MTLPPASKCMLTLCFSQIVQNNRIDLRREWRENGTDTAWDRVGRHVHWAPHLFEISQSYLRRLFDVADSDPIPPVRAVLLVLWWFSAHVQDQYLSVHIRRGDFTNGHWSFGTGKLCRP